MDSFFGVNGSLWTLFCRSLLPFFIPTGAQFDEKSQQTLSLNSRGRQAAELGPFGRLMWAVVVVLCIARSGHVQEVLGLILATTYSLFMRASHSNLIIFSVLEKGLERAYSWDQKSLH